MSRLRHLPWAIALVCVVLGFMLSMQFKVQKQVKLTDLTAMSRAQDLAQQLEQAEKARDDSMTELEQLRQEMTKVINQQAGFEDLGRQLEEAQRAAGLVALTGQGVVIEMRDATRPLAPGETANNLLIHDYDVLRVINELFASGAEAMSINEQRVIGRTEIICAGPVVIVNGIRTAPPIVIKAIGKAEDLEMAITMKGGLAETLRSFGIHISVQRETNLTIPAFKGSLKMQYGTPAQ
ncbi:MAG: hypothetical protein K0R39_4315 [Symbiobacteriaceae bacterium]|jgi:uncharacterized protein YlxW (UPF0749 family)|nr:hypothetical protein [Symbiobacteriaceae bacterium]